MIPAYDLEATILGGAIGVADVVGSDGETIARRIVATIYEFVERADFAEIFGVNAEESAAAFVRIGFRAVGADFVGDCFRIRRWFPFFEAGVKTPSLADLNGTTEVVPCYEPFPTLILESLLFCFFPEALA